MEPKGNNIPREQSIRMSGGITTSVLEFLLELGLWLLGEQLVRREFGEILSFWRARGRLVSGKMGEKMWGK